MSRLLGNGGQWVPQVCVDMGLMNDLLICFAQEPRCLLNCFPFNGRRQEFFDISPLQLQDPEFRMDCSQFEEPVCAITECVYCSDCVDTINALYRCVVNEMESVDKRMKRLVNCPLDCETTTDSFLLDTESNFTETASALGETTAPVAGGTSEVPYSRIDTSGGGLN